MSGDNDADKGFLSRWSQRKREAKLPDVDDTAVQVAQEAKALPAVVGSEAEEEFDLSSLPKLEDVSGATDITGFLRKGVPESLKNAVLRKSWALDPAIRNYVNPALDYAYDWNTPGGVPGNSELAAGTDIAKMVLQIMGGGSAEEAVAPDAQATPTSGQDDAPDAISGPVEIGASQDARPEPADDSVRLSVSVDPSMLVQTSESLVTVANDGSFHDRLLEPSAMQQPVRRHGSAKPKV